MLAAAAVPRVTWGSVDMERSKMVELEKKGCGELDEWRGKWLTGRERKIRKKKQKETERKRKKGGRMRK